MSGDKYNKQGTKKERKQYKKIHNNVKLQNVQKWTKLTETNSQVQRRKSLTYTTLD